MALFLMGRGTPTLATLDDRKEHVIDLFAETEVVAGTCIAINKTIDYTQD
jgi:hypothetical protein